MPNVSTIASKRLAQQFVFQVTYQWKDGDNYYISGVYNAPRKTSIDWVLKQVKQFHPNAAAISVTIGPDEVR